MTTRIRIPAVALQYYIIQEEIDLETGKISKFKGLGDSAVVQGNEMPQFLEIAIKQFFRQKHGPVVFGDEE